jgi:hypothetical protein
LKKSLGAIDKRIDELKTKLAKRLKPAAAWEAA